MGPLCRVCGTEQPEAAPSSDDGAAARLAALEEQAREMFGAQADLAAALDAANARGDDLAAKLEQATKDLDAMLAAPPPAAPAEPAPPAPEEAAAPPPAAEPAATPAPKASRAKG